MLTSLIFKYSNDLTNSMAYQMIRNMFSENMFKQDDLVIFLAESMEEFEYTQSGIKMKLEGRFFRPQQKTEIANKYRKLIDTDPSILKQKGIFEDPEKVGKIDFELEFTTEDIVRFKIKSGITKGEFKPLDAPTICESFDPHEVQLMMETEAPKPEETAEKPRKTIIIAREIDDGRQIILKSRLLKIEIDDFPFDIRIYDYNNNLVYKLLEKYENIGPLGIHLPLGFAYSKKLNRTFTFISNVLHYNEHVYGFGEDFGPLDKRNREIILESADATSSDTDYMYKPIPFFSTTRGYGFFVNRSEPMRFSVGKDYYHALNLQIVSDTLDIYCITASTIMKIIKKYTEITGRPNLPPKWSFGFWLSRISYRSQEQVENIAEEMRKNKIPCDVIHIDTDWFEKDWQCDWKFDPKKFPDPKGMADKLHDMGFHISLWQLPYITKDTSVYQEALQKGYFQTINGKLINNETGILDFSNPEAVKWYTDKLSELLKLGIDIIKVDFGESIPINADFEKYPGIIMHNLYPLLYNKICYELTERIKGKDQALIWARSTWAGSQRYPVHWSGDPKAKFYAMYHTLRGGLSLGLSGFTFWSHDIGGFAGRPSPELYSRWAQFGFFTSHSRAHGTPPREPWEYGEETLKIFRKYAELKYQLFPYIYSTAYYSAKRGIPIVRAMVLEFQDDPSCYTIDDQYMFGDNLLIAPVFEERQTSRKIYLPKGKWYDFWSDELYEGPIWVEYETPLDKLPIFVKMYSVIPMIETEDYIKEERFKNIKFHLYGTGEVQGTLLFTYYDGGMENQIEIIYDKELGFFRIHEHVREGEKPPEIKEFLIEFHDVKIEKESKKEPEEEDEFK